MDDFAQSDGAFRRSPTGEAFYKELFNGSANNVARAKNARENNSFVAVLA